MTHLPQFAHLLDKLGLSINIFKANVQKKMKTPPQIRQYRNNY